MDVILIKMIMYNIFGFEMFQKCKKKKKIVIEEIMHSFPFKRCKSTNLLNMYLDKTDKILSQIKREG